MNCIFKEISLENRKKQKIDLKNLGNPLEMSNARVLKTIFPKIPNELKTRFCKAIYDLNSTETFS
jgi:hypothetical protein